MAVRGGEGRVGEEGKRKKERQRVIAKEEEQIS